jgi:hypothetical protein
MAAALWTTWAVYLQEMVSIRDPRKSLKFTGMPVADID